MFRFGCGHIKVDPEIHEASWGARLIYTEVAEARQGQTPVVWDRQTPDGDPEKVRLLWPVVDRAMDEFRLHRYELDSASRGHLCWRDGRALVVMSPQGSYGYLYVTAVLEKEGHEGESDVWEWKEDMEGQIELGNWPPRVVAAQKAEKLRVLQSSLKWLDHDIRFQEIQVRAATTPRAKAIRQHKLDKIEMERDEVLANIAALLMEVSDGPTD